MTVASPAFLNGAEIPREYGCGGAGTVPPLSFASVPQSAKSLALIATDPDAPGGLFTHWVVWNIPPGAAPHGVEGKNDFGKTGYGPPCPPSGSHRYFFDVYALDTTIDLPAGSTREAVEAAMKGHVLARGELVGTYRK